MRASPYRTSFALVVLACAAVAVAGAGPDPTEAGSHQGVFFAAPAEDGYFVTGGSDKNVRLWKIDEKNKTAVEVLPSFVAGEAVLAVSAKGKYVVAGGRGGKLTLWRRTDSFTKVPNSSGSSAFVVDATGKSVAFATTAGAFLWDQPNDPVAANLKQKTGITALARGDDFLIVGSKGQVETLDTTNNKSLSSITGLPVDSLKALAIRAKGEYLVLDGQGVVRRTAPPQSKSEDGKIGTPKLLAVSGNAVGFAMADGKNLKVRTAGENKETTAPGMQNALALAASQQGDVVAFVEADNKGQYWDVGAKEIKKVEGKDFAKVSDKSLLAVHASGTDKKVVRVAAVTEKDGKLTLAFRSSDKDEMLSSDDKGELPDKSVTQIAFAPDGHSVLVVGDSKVNVVRKIQTSDRTEKTLTTGSTKAVTSLGVIGGDDPSVAVGTDGNVFVLKLDDGSIIATIAGKPTSLAAGGVDDRGRVRLVWSEADGRLRLFQVLSGAFTELQNKATTLKRSPLGVAFTGKAPDADSAKVGYVDGDTLKLWEPDVREAYVFAPDARITLDPQGKSVLNTSQDGKTSAFQSLTADLKDGPLTPLDAGEQIKAAVILTDQLVTASKVSDKGGDKGRLRFWKLSNTAAPSLDTSKDLDQPITALAFDPTDSGPAFVVRFANGPLQRLAADGSADGAALGAAVPTGTNLAVAALKGKRILAASDQELQSWDPAAQQQLDSQPTGHGPVYAIAWRPTDKTFQFVTAGGDGKVAGWEIQGDKLVSSWVAFDVGDKKPLYAAAFLDDGRFATVGKDGKLRTFKATDSDKKFATPTVLKEIDAGGVLLSLAVRPVNGMNKRLIVTASSDKRVRAWDFDGGAVGKEVSHNDSVSAVAFNADGSQLASIDFRGEARAYAVDKDGVITTPPRVTSNLKPPATAYSIVWGKDALFVPAKNKLYRFDVK
jgi:WD40 repeat protein